MRYFLAYRYSGENPATLQERIGKTVEALTSKNLDVYCNLFDQHDYDVQNLSAGEIMQKAFREIDECDGLFVLIASSDKSEGQLMEVGYSIAKGKRIVAAVQNDAKTYVSELADVVISWADAKDLTEKIGSTDI